MRALALSFISFLLSVPVYADVAENWDDPAAAFDGWTYAGVGTASEYVETGGNPGGYMKISGNRVIGIANNSQFFTGDYAAKGFNQASFDVMVLLQQLEAYKPYLSFRYSSSFNGWKYVFEDFTINSAGTWQHLSVSFDPTWTDVEAEANGWAPVDTYNLKPFGETMGHVDTFTLLSDYPQTVGKVLGFDNVTLHGPYVPEPATGLLLLMGAASLGLLKSKTSV